MAQLRHFQLFRSSTVYANLSAAKNALGNQINDLSDGEMALARYYSKPVSETGTAPDHNVHVVLGVVRIGTDSATEKPLKSMDFIYCGSEVTQKINTAIQALDVDAITPTYTNGVLTLYPISEVDGKIQAGNAVTVNIATDIANAINNLDVAGYTQASISANQITISGIKEENGKIAADSGKNVTIDVDGTVSSTNKLATQTTVSTAIDAIAGAGLAVSSTGTVSATTQSATDNSTNVATTAFVKTAIDNLDTASAQTTSAVSKSADNKTITITPYTLNEANGIVSTTAGTSVTLNINQEQSANNPIATMADVTATNLTGVDSITVNNTNHKVSLTIDSNDKVLTQSETGLLANISMRYDSTAKKIYLEGKGTTKAQISEIDATDFVKDGMITKVEVVETAERGVTTEAPYLKITWNNDGPTPQISRVSLKNLVDVYTADETYLHMNDHKVEHKTSGVTAASYGESATATKNYAGTISIPRLTVDAAGHVTAASNSIITLPSKQTASDALSMTVSSNKATITDTFTLDTQAQTGSSVTIEAVDGLKLTSDGTNGAKIGHSTTRTDSDSRGAITFTDSTLSQNITIDKVDSDAFGHVTTRDRKTLTVTLPASIATAVQSVTSEDSVIAGSSAQSGLTQIIATRADNSNGVILTSVVKNGGIRAWSADADSVFKFTPNNMQYTAPAMYMDGEWKFQPGDGNNPRNLTDTELQTLHIDNFQTAGGIATDTEIGDVINHTRTEVLAGENTTVSRTMTPDGGYVYTVNATGTPVTGVTGNPVIVDTHDNTTTVQLNTVTVTSATGTNTMADTTNTHDYISSITVDSYGRVTGYTTTTMTENFDCGTF